MNEDTIQEVEETPEPIEEIPEEPISGEDVQENPIEFDSIPETPDSTYNIDDIVLRLDNLERVQVTFFDNLLDVLLIACVLLLAIPVVKEFMDRSTRW
ncbi:hypothetical protein KZX50_26275 [Bacillus infantis]|uniref:hypothetical protein n=1 Tax=Bacillus infantis TaxID=324767 RepID=UPI002004599D|nr:hypothetical protein [Bacillus infantis]MCK6208919.1 hypothetical protein [Bacillus infantis]